MVPTNCRQSSRGRYRGTSKGSRPSSTCADVATKNCYAWSDWVERVAETKSS